MKKSEYSHKRRLSRCLPALLRDEGIHAAFYTTSNLGSQRKLGFAEVWSSVEEENARHATPRKRGKSPRFSQDPELAERIHWPADWWKNNTASLLRARTEGQYNWLGDHDFFGLPKVQHARDPALTTYSPVLVVCALHLPAACACCLPGRFATLLRHRESSGSSYIS
jgi:hypothetical protein